MLSLIPALARSYKSGIPTVSLMIKTAEASGSVCRDFPALKYIHFKAGINERCAGC